MTKEFKSNHYMWAWLSPACPVGAFSYSQGLESAINDGLVQDIKTLKLWLSSNLQYGSIKNDSIFIVGFQFSSLNISKFEIVASKFSLTLGLIIFNLRG